MGRFAASLLAVSLHDVPWALQSHAMKSSQLTYRIYGIPILKSMFTNSGAEVQSGSGFCRSWITPFCLRTQTSTRMGPSALSLRANNWEPSWLEESWIANRNWLWRWTHSLAIHKFQLCSWIACRFLIRQGRVNPSQKLALRQQVILRQDVAAKNSVARFGCRYVFRRCMRTKKTRAS